MTLDPDQTHTIISALRVARETYEQDARTTVDHPRLVEQFNRQAEQAGNLADKLERQALSLTVDEDGRGAAYNLLEALVELVQHVDEDVPADVRSKHLTNALNNARHLTSGKAAASREVVTATLKVQQDYLAAAGCVCPVCGSTELTSEDDVVITSSDSAEHPVGCASCGAMWCDQLKLAGLSDIRIPARHNEHG